MQKIITDEKIKAIVDAFYQINAPVQVFTTVQKMLSELPVVETPKTE